MRKLTAFACEVPKYVFWVKAYPKTASGKIQKFKLQALGKELILGERGQEESEESAC